MAKPNSIRLKKQALQCETAAKLADFLERHVAIPCYDFVLPDLLSFKCDETLLKLREISTWQALEDEFRSVGGWLSEDWDELETDEVIPPHIKRTTPKVSRLKIDLILVTIAVSALVGASIGWFFPWLTVPGSESQQQTIRRVD